MASVRASNYNYTYIVSRDAMYSRIGYSDCGPGTRTSLFSGSDDELTAFILRRVLIYFLCFYPSEVFIISS